MILADRYQGLPPSAPPAPAAGYSCSRYEPLAGEKRCRYYQQGGTCSLPDEFLCREWARVNGLPVPEERSRAKAGSGEDQAAPECSSGTNAPSVSAEAPRVLTDLFGTPLPAPKPTPKPEIKRERPAPAPVTSPPPATEAKRPVLAGLTLEDIQTFRAHRLEVCFRSPALGEVYLVPEYSGQARSELTPEDAAAICLVLQAFPGSEIQSLRRAPHRDQEATP